MGLMYLICNNSIIDFAYFPRYVARQLILNINCQLWQYMSKFSNSVHRSALQAWSHRARLHLQVSYLFSNKGKKESRAPQYKMKDFDENKLPDHLKKVYKAKRQAYNMEVPSEADLEVKNIIESIVRQRTEIEQLSPTSSSSQSKGQRSTTFMRVVAGVNWLPALLLCTPLIHNHWFYLGVLSKLLVFPSLIACAFLAMGVNLSYVLVRQGLQMQTPLESLTNVNLISSPFGFWAETFLIFTQMVFFMFLYYCDFDSIHAVAELGAISLLFPLIALSVNMHAGYLNRKFKNPSYKFKTHSILYGSLLVLNLLLGAIGEGQQGEYEKGREYIKRIWRVSKASNQDGHIMAAINDSATK